MTKTALEKRIDGNWIPVAIRRQRFSARERKELLSGLEVVNSEGVFRRVNHVELAAENHALVRAIGRHQKDNQ